MNCSNDECVSPAKTRGLCHKHYMRWYVNERETTACSVDGCDKPQYAKKMCQTHRQRVLRYGDPHTTKSARYMSDHDYLVWNKELQDSGCWYWSGALTKSGYGSASRLSRHVLAHRLAYETWVGPIPEGYDIRHRCDNRPCINPDHLESGTRAENNRDTSIRDRHGNAKLSNDDVIDIRWAHGLGATGSSLARAYGVTPTLISQIVNRKARTNI